MEGGRNPARRVIVDGREAVEIELNHEKVALVDPEDWPTVKDYWWSAIWRDGRFYAETSPVKGEAKIKLHQLIMGTSGVSDVDHKIGSRTLDNRKSNLRPCDNPLNQQNTGSRGGTSQFKNVSWIDRKRKWAVAFRYKGEHHFVGYFDDEEVAARARDEAVKQLGCPFTRLNFPDSPDQIPATVRSTREEKPSRQLKRRGSTSRFIGVSRYASTGRWAAKCVHEGKARHVGYFSTEEEAARAYDEIAAKLGLPLNFRPSR